MWCIKKNNYLCRVLLLVYRMKTLVKYSVLLLVAIIYLGQGIDSTRYLAKTTEQERLISHEKDNFERLAMLTAMNGNALPVNTVQEGANVLPTFRYLQKNNTSVYLEEYRKIFIPYFRYIENDYLDSFASKQDGGYYVFALCEIIV